MRQTLFRIWLERPWAFWTEFADDPPRLGACWVLVILGCLVATYHLLRGQRTALKDPVPWLAWGVAVLALSLAPLTGRLPEWVPVFGYGVMVLLGFVSAMGFAHWRAKAIGFNPELILDSAMWLLVGGVAGGRLAYIIQYRDRFIGQADSFPEFLFNLVNLSEGGLVLIGALFGGGIGFMAFCRSRKIDPYEFADLLTPAIFIGIGFGRIGCLLNGCCYGDRCDLPWAITFAQGTTTFKELMMRGFVDPSAAATIPLHPTQIYSAIDGFLLAFVTGVAFWYRRYPGNIFALGCILYSITRFQIEFLRSDEMGQLGTGLTISQLYCIVMLAFGIYLLLSAPRRRSKSMPSAVLQKEVPAR